MSREAKEKLGTFIINSESVDSVFNFDFFDKIENQTYWTILVNSSQTLGTIRSLVWPGYLGYHFFGKKTFGGLYFGNGLKQVDLPFYLWNDKLMFKLSYLQTHLKKIFKFRSMKFVDTFRLL